MTEKMKPSGIAWIGDIPQDWNIKRVKYLASLKGRIGWQGLTSDEYIDEGPYLITGIDFQNGGIDWNNCVHVSEERWAEAPEIHIQNGDLLITKDGTVGKVAIVSGLEGKASLNSGVLLIRTNPDFDKRFLFWVLQSEEFWTWFRLKNAGNSTIIHLYQGDFAEFSYTFPNTVEQRAIADFLDSQCAKIDSVIADIEKQIETLQKYKKSLITETVTKGLDRSVPMKDSGIEWIGVIPTTWNVRPLKHLTNSIIDGTHHTPTYIDDGVPFLRVTDITSEDDIDKPINLDTVARIPIAEHKELLLRCAPQKGDLLVSKNGTIGVPKIVDWDWEFSMFVSLCLIKLKEPLLNKWLYYYFKSSLSATEIAFGGKTNTITNLHLEKIANFKIPLPLIDEQVKICEYLDKKIRTIDEMMAHKKQQLELIIQHKKSLIYEYVTGKKRVTEVN